MTLEDNLEQLNNITDYNRQNELIDQMMNTLSNMKKENSKNSRLQRKYLLNKKVQAKYQKSKESVIRISKENFNKLRGKLGLIPIKLEQGLYKAEIQTMKGLNNIKFRITDSRELLNKKIQTKKENIKNSVAKFTKSKIDLIKQKINFEKNTVRFKNMISNLNRMTIEAENKVINSANTVKNNVVELKDKSVLKFKNLSQKIENKKNVIFTVTSTKLNDIKNNISNKKDKVVSNVDLKLYNLKNKMLLSKYKIQRKIEHNKNVVKTTTDMQIAFIKDSISKKMTNIKNSVNNFVSPSEEILQENRNKIAKLKEERAKLIEEFMAPKENQEIRGFSM